MSKLYLNSQVKTLLLQPVKNNACFGIDCHYLLFVFVTIHWTCHSGKGPPRTEKVVLRPLVQESLDGDRDICAC